MSQTTVTALRRAFEIRTGVGALLAREITDDPAPLLALYSDQPGAHAVRVYHFRGRWFAADAPFGCCCPDHATPLGRDAYCPVH